MRGLNGIVFTPPIDIRGSGIVFTPPIDIRGSGIGPDVGPMPPTTAPTLPLIPVTGPSAYCGLGFGIGIGPGVVGNVVAGGVVAGVAGFCAPVGPPGTGVIGLLGFPSPWLLPLMSTLSIWLRHASRSAISAGVKARPPGRTSLRPNCQ